MMGGWEGKAPRTSGKIIVCILSPFFLVFFRSIHSIPFSCVIVLVACYSHSLSVLCAASELPAHPPTYIQSHYRNQVTIIGVISQSADKRASIV
ncbi:hypothetical protein C8R44DRAFT_779193 [Mycena epipterygia]|nr:hypothetical protein C8R44DRAFT_779193 [Mycena epipterygia]